MSDKMSSWKLQMKDTTINFKKRDLYIFIQRKMRILTDDTLLSTHHRTRDR